ncbi:hypothetical protein ABJ972_01180 [Mesomycoplasma hyopneumoniae]|uniref:hypothetical protein n=1 Tax=Mesomycoplasma hyopneumoniae TaxID=2099 RepID=UPI0032AF361C
MSLGNIVVAQPYEENRKNKLKNLFARIKDNFLSKIKNKKSKNHVKRSLFTEYQRLNIQDWINRIQRAMNEVLSY